MSADSKSELKVTDVDAETGPGPVVHCGGDFQADLVRTDGTDFVTAVKTENDAASGETTKADADTDVSVASNSVTTSTDEFSLTKNNLSLIKTLQELGGPEPAVKSEPIVKAEPNSESSKLSNGHHDAAKKSRSHDGDEKSSHRDRDRDRHRDRYRDRDRDRDRDRHRPKRANIGIQCRRDKTYEKTVGFAPAAAAAAPTATSTSTPTATLTSPPTVTLATPTSASPTPAASSEVPSEVRMARGFANSPRYAGYSMANPCYNLANKYKYGHLMRVEIYPNGGGKVLHLWQDEFDHLNEQEVDELARDFVKVKDWRQIRHFLSLLTRHLLGFSGMS